MIYIACSYLPTTVADGQLEDLVSRLQFWIRAMTHAQDISMIDGMQTEIGIWTEAAFHSKISHMVEVSVSV